jgi:hypothetical protein
LLEAMAAGPAVATSQATKKVSVRAGEHWLVADVAAGFLRAPCKGSWTVRSFACGWHLRRERWSPDPYSWERSAGEIEGVHGSAIGDGAAQPLVGVEGSLAPGGQPPGAGSGARLSPSPARRFGGAVDNLDPSRGLGYLSPRRVDP